ncbi:MAG: lipoyl synthase, partial [Coriobacteriia bacterium]|nr:lipoyl synthase [Coriobacteriia bacterium]
MSLTDATSQEAEARKLPLRKPPWLRLSRSNDPNQQLVEGLLKELGLNTVCKEANCPNYSDCFSRKTATFLIMGTVCTRNCRFCNVSHGPPKSLDPSEPARVAQAVQKLGLNYVVVTSVTRDDLPDGGATHFSATICAIKQATPTTAIEVLIPDFQGSAEALALVAAAQPKVISHNIETVAELYPQVRAQANYQQSLDLLAAIKQHNPHIISKSGIMLGLGETREQLTRLFADLRTAGCEVLTIGQYLAPSLDHYPVQEYLEPALFEEYGELAREYGFKVVSAPLVRSSYRAHQVARLG